MNQPINQQMELQNHVASVSRTRLILPDVNEHFEENSNAVLLVRSNQSVVS